jgi:hypothetical protein
MAVISLTMDVIVETGSDKENGSETETKAKTSDNQPTVVSESSSGEDQQQPIQQPIQRSHRF